MREQKQYINKNPLVPQWPFRLLISAPSGTGKTNILMNLIMSYLHWDKIYIVSKMIKTEDKYIELTDWIKVIENNIHLEMNMNDMKIGHFYDKFEDLDDVDDFDEKFQNLVVVDDMITTKNQTKITEMAIRGRKKNISFIYLTQSFFDVPKLLRKNITDYIFLNVGSKRELQEIAKTVAYRISYDEFIKLYNECVQEPYGFVYISSRDKELCKWIRCGFDGLYCGTEQ